jgi:hypothetical protein
MFERSNTLLELGDVASKPRCLRVGVVVGVHERSSRIFDARPWLMVIVHIPRFVLMLAGFRRR